MRFVIILSRAVLPAVAILVLFGSCAGTSRGVSKQLVAMNEKIEQLDKQMANANKKIAAIETDVTGTTKKVKGIESSINANTEEAYLKVLIPVLNIRTNPTTINSNIIAKARQGAYLRKVSEEDEGKWVQVEFLIDNYPYLGYTANNPEFIKEEVHDPVTFSRLYNRKLIRHMWETEVALELRSKKVTTVGVYVKTSEAYRSDRFLGHLSAIFREHNIYIKPLDSFEISKVMAICKQNKVGGLMAVEFEETDADNSPQLDIKLFDSNSLILYSALIPLQSIELPANLGRK